MKEGQLLIDGAVKLKIRTVSLLGLLVHRHSARAVAAGKTVL